MVWKHLQALEIRLAGNPVMKAGAGRVPARYFGQKAKAAAGACSKERRGLSS